MRLSRLMDPAQTGKFENLSLKQLVHADANLTSAESLLRTIWDESNLKTVRDKYLSHNDLHRLSGGEHTLNMLIQRADYEAIRNLLDGLRTFRCTVHRRLNKPAYVDSLVGLQVRRDLDRLDAGLRAGSCFFKLLPDHAYLQKALAATEAQMPSHE